MQTGFVKRAAVGAIGVAAALLAGTAQAALQDRDLNGDSVVDAFYDTDLDITWLRDAAVGGRTDWDTAVTWASAYSIGGYTGWRLPKSDTCTGYNCTNSEMGHLWYVELGNFAGDMTNTGGFQGLSRDLYFSGTDYPGHPEVAMGFAMINGGQGGALKADRWYVMVVRDGDVPAVPEPATAALMLAGVSVLAAVARRRPR